MLENVNEGAVMPTDEERVNEITNFVNGLGLTTEKKSFSWGDVDVFVADKNIGINYNGLYWTSDKDRPVTFYYDKTTKAQEEGVRLIHIWEHEWLHNQEKIKSYIKAQLGICEHRVYGRECEVREIDLKTAKPLLQYHQQKSVAANVYLGLYHKDELMLIMLFAKHKNYGWEVKREVCKEGYSIVGGKSKAFAYFVNKYQPEQIVSFVDRSKFTGNSYEIMGFKLHHIVTARYDWMYPGTLTFKKRQPSIYQKMKVEYKEGRMWKTYDAGRFCYIWDKNNPVEEKQKEILE